MDRAHRDRTAPGFLEGLPPGEHVQVVGVEQGAVDVEQHGGAQVRHGRGPSWYGVRTQVDRERDVRTVAVVADAGPH